MKAKTTKQTEESRANANAVERTNTFSGMFEGMGQDQAVQEKHNNIIQNSPYMTAQKNRLQSSFGPAQKKENKTGMPDEVKSHMESSFNTDFSDVRIHAGSSKAPEVGALAYTQGSDIHFASGRFKPDTSPGKQLLGHELAHVVQQREGRVQPTTEVAGMPVNDNPALEKEADVMGAKAAG